ncbi:MAG: hypothetical protein H0Z35_12365 [Thermoanaerobacteraceae bacterium]|nr:hypothetical protein [Thermoanaerobacteraceae bacterium]
MPLTVKIGGVDVTEAVRRDEFNIQDAINERSHLTLKLESSISRPKVGEKVEVYDGEIKIFGGEVDEPETIELDGGEKEYDVPVVDNHAITDRRIVAEVYENQTAGFIFTDIISKYLAAEGITAGNIQDGPTITKAVFNYVPVSQCFDELSELTGFQWVINADKSADFFNRTTFVAPISIDENSNIRNVRIRRSRADYRNRQYIRAGKDVSDPRTESFKGDGATRTFTVALPIAKAPTITVNGVEQSVGIGQVESGKQWYWNEGEKTFYQDYNEPVLTSTDTVEITYQGYFPIMVVADEESAQAERKSIEGGTGIYESVEEAANINSGDAAMEYAMGKLRRYAKISEILTFNTFEAGLKPGQLLSVNLPSYGLSGEFLISRVTITDPGRADGALNYYVEALSGEAVGSWTSFFKKIIQQGKTFVIRENEVLIRLVQFRDRVMCGDSMTVSSATPESRMGYAIIGFSEIA